MAIFVRVEKSHSEMYDFLSGSEKNHISRGFFSRFFKFQTQKWTVKREFSTLTNIATKLI